MPRRFRSVALLVKACVRLLQYTRFHLGTADNIINRASQLRTTRRFRKGGQIYQTASECSQSDVGRAIHSADEDDPTSDLTSSADSSSDTESEDEAPRDWVQEEKDLDENQIQRRKHEDKTINLKKWVWELWCRFCAETTRDALTLMKEDPPSVKTLWTFFDYTVTKRRQYIDAASTLQTYWNVWTLIRREESGLPIPPLVKDKMTGVRDQLAEKHGLRTQKRKKPVLRSEGVFNLLVVLWTINSETWDPLQLGLIILLAGISGHRPDALVSMRHEDVAVTLLPTGRERPHMVLEIKPHKTKRYRGKKKQNPTLGIPEVPSEPCLLLCPKTLLLGLLVRKSAFRHLHVRSARQLYALQVPPDAGSLELRPTEPEARLFDISAGTLNAWLKRLGELAGFDLPITSYWFRRGTGEAVNSSSEISEAQQNLLLQHASGSVYQANYAPDYFPADLGAIWRGRQQQKDVIRMASGPSRTINLRRPVELNATQAAEAEHQPEVQQRKCAWNRAKQRVQQEFGTFANGKGSAVYEKAMRRRNRYHTVLQASRRAMKDKIRARFNQEQPVQDVLRQIHGLPMESKRPCKASPVSPEQGHAFALLLRFAPSSEREETECRAAVVDAVSQVGPSRKRRLRLLHSTQPAPTWMNNALNGKSHVELARRQCLFCLVFGIREQPFSRDSSFERHVQRHHNHQTRCPDLACQGALMGHIDITNHMRYFHGA